MARIVGLIIPKEEVKVEEVETTTEEVKTRSRKTSDKK